MASKRGQQRLLVLLLIASVLMGCSDNGNDSGSTNETPPQSAPDAEPPSVVEPSPTPTGPEPSPPPDSREPPQTPPPAQSVCLELEPAFTALTVQQPLALLQAPGDTQHWYVMERPGRVLRITEQTAAEASAFIDISAQVDTAGEGGLLGMAFHPDFPRTPYVYLSYTTSADTGNARGFRSVVSRFTVSDDEVSLQPQSEWPLITLRQPYSNHNGGQIAFGPDGYLYFGLGDGGSAGDPKNHAQNPRTLFGAMLRLDVNVSESDITNGLRYRIPPGHPFTGAPVCREGMCPDMEQNQCAAPGCAEIFAWGLRNPWRWSFDRETGALWVGDVGQNAREEIDIVEAGDNLGWSCFEGNAGYKPDRCTNNVEVTPPVAEYDHPLMGSASVTGGYVYRGKALPGLQGTYLYADFVSGELFALVDAYGARRNQRIMETGSSIASLAEDADGEIYALSLFNPSGIFRLEASADTGGENCIAP